MYVTNQKVIGSVTLFEDLAIEIVEDLGSRGETIVYPLFPFYTIKLPKEFDIEVLIAELNHYYLNRLFFPDTVHNSKTLDFSCFVSELMVHGCDVCKNCEKYASKECVLYPKSAKSATKNRTES